MEKQKALSTLCRPANPCFQVLTRIIHSHSYNNANWLHIERNARSFSWIRIANLQPPQVGLAVKKLYE